MFKEFQELSPTHNQPPQVQPPQSQTTGVPQARTTTIQREIASPHRVPGLTAQSPSSQQVNPSASTSTTSTASFAPSNQAQAQIAEFLRLLSSTATNQQIKELTQQFGDLTQQIEGLPTSIVALKKQIEQTATSSELETMLKQLNRLPFPANSDQWEVLNQQMGLIVHALIDIKNNQNSSRIQKLFGWKIPDWKWKDKAERWVKPTIKPLTGILLLTLMGAIVLGIARMGELNRNLDLLNSTLENSTRRPAK